MFVQARKRADIQEQGSAYTEIDNARKEKKRKLFNVRDTQARPFAANRFNSSNVYHHITSSITERRGVWTDDEVLRCA